MGNLLTSGEVKSIKELEERPNKHSTQPGNKIFKAYLGQLVVRILLGIFFVLLQALLLYPRSFPSIFHCHLAKEGKITASRNVKQAQTTYECIYQRAGNKTFWAYAVIVVTGTFTLFALVEMLYIFILLPRKEEKYMEDRQFHEYHLKSKSKPTTDLEQPLIPSTGEQDNKPSNFLRKRFRSRSKHFLERLSTAKSERKSMKVIRDENRQYDVRDPVARFTIQNSVSLKEYVVTISVAPSCQCEDYKKFNKLKEKQLCKHIIWIYLFQLGVDEEHCLIQQIALERDEVKQILEIPRVKAILSKDNRNDQRRTWYLSHKERKPGINPRCKAFRCEKKFHLENFVFMLKGYKCNWSHPKSTQQKVICSFISVREEPAFSNSHYGQT